MINVIMTLKFEISCHTITKKEIKRERISIYSFINLQKVRVRIIILYMYNNRLSSF